jgi:hypothetical protein
VTGNPFHRKLFRLRRQARPKRLLIVHGRVLSEHVEPLAQVLRRLDSSWEIRLRPHFNERAHAARLAARLGVDLEPDVPLHESLAATRVAVGVYSTALLDAWVAGCKVVHLGAPQVLLDRYGDSGNVLNGIDGLDEFLRAPAAIDDAEDLRVNRVTVCSEVFGFSESVDKTVEQKMATRARPG